MIFVVLLLCFYFFFFFKQKTAYEMRISDWSSDVCSSDLNIGQLARQAGVPIDTVRYYERQRLIPEPARSASGYRQYAQDDVTRLNFIRRAKTLGFTLEEIGELMAISGNYSDDMNEMRN